MDFLIVPEYLCTCAFDQVQNCRRVDVSILQRLYKSNRQIFSRPSASDGIIVDDNEAMVQPISGQRNGQPLWHS